MSDKKVAIIGGGCCGLLLSNLLKDSGVQITVFEKNNKLGKKILASGNGKCNFTNLLDLHNKYNNKFANEIIERFDSMKTISFLETKGLIYKTDGEGRCYPVSESSNSVLDCLKIGLNNVCIELDTTVKNVVKSGNGYNVFFDDKKEYFDYVVCCSGSIASNLGNLKAYEYLSGLDVKITDLNPSLVPLKVKENVSSLKGSRVKCLVKLIDEKENVVYEEYGEVMFKEQGLSGIAIFNASSYINRKKGQYKIYLDLSCGISKKDLYKYLISKKEFYPKVFTGFLNDKLSEYIISCSNPCYSEENVNCMLDMVFNLKFNVVGTYPFVDSQVCSGGVSLNEVNENLELKKYPHVYIGGELLDVDGVCGGYNMQFAWSCAGVISESIKLSM